MSERKTTQDRLGRDPDGSSSQASPEAASHLRPSGVDLSRMRWQPIISAPHDIPWLPGLPDGCDFGPGWAVSKNEDEFLFLIWCEQISASSTRITHWYPLPPAPGIEAGTAETRQGLGTKSESPIAVGEAPTPSAPLMHEALKAMDEALTVEIVGPEYSGAVLRIGWDGVNAWKLVRSALSQAKAE